MLYICSLKMMENNSENLLLFTLVCCIYGTLIAQFAEHETDNWKVAGSSPPPTLVIGRHEQSAHLLATWTTCPPSDNTNNLHT